MKTVYVVVDRLVNDPDDWELHLASILHGYADATNTQDVCIEEVEDLAGIKKLFSTHKITAEDVFVFPNAWISAVPYIRHWSEIYNIPVKMIGLWSRGCHINNDDVYRPLGDRNWRKVRERGNFRCLDKSFFISEYHKEQFRIYVSKVVFPERLHVCKFPLDYLDIELSPLRDTFFKQNHVVFPWSSYDTFREQILFDFVRVFPDYQVIFSRDQAPFERHQVLNYVSKAKVVFFPYTYPNIGKEIYECLLLNAIPLIPRMEGMEDLVADEFQYPAEWTENIFNYCKFAPDLTSKIRDLVDNYEQYGSLINANQMHLKEHYFDSEEIIKEIFGNPNRF